MAFLDFILIGIELVISKTPVLSAIAEKREKQYPLRILNSSELVSDNYIKMLCTHLNKVFKKTDYSRIYTKEQLSGWMKKYPDAFIVSIKKKWLTKRQFIYYTVKFLPLSNDLVTEVDFNPFFIKPEDIASDEKLAKAIWIGDLTSTENDLITIILLLTYRIKNTKAPVYCRTAKDQLRRILFERYGFKVLNANGTNADANTILVLASRDAF